MTNKEINNAIKSLGPWYQKYELRGKYTTNESVSDETEFLRFKKILKLNKLRNLRVLDLGSNAGLYSVLMALDGAKVIGIDSDKKCINQAAFTKYFFEFKEKKKELDVKFINIDISNIDYTTIGRFDLILASNVLEYITFKTHKMYSPESIKEQKYIISKLCNITDRILVRTPNDRVENSIGFYNSVFLENGLYLVRRDVSKNPLLLYGRLTNSEDYTW